MKTILKLWNGELDQEALYSARIKKEEKKQEDEKELSPSDIFYKSLSKEQEKLFFDSWMEEAEEWNKEVDGAFVDGFRIGALLMLEILQEDR